MSIKLILPCSDYADSWLEAIQAFVEEGVAGFWTFPSVPTDIESYLERTEKAARGEELPEGWVPNSTYWLIADGKFVGHANLRHELNDGMRKRGGHIGYYIAPGERRKGYGSLILPLMLEKARERGLEKVLLTCDEDNPGSRKIIEAAGGVLQDVIPVGEERMMRYWIQIGPGVG